MEAKHGAKEIKIDNGAWTRYTGITTDVTVSENCTVYARVTNGTNNMKTNEVIVSKIDKTAPIVTPISESVTINVGDSNEISSYFNITANGIAPIKTITYVNISDKNKEPENTNTLLSGTNVIQCTVVKESGTTTVATITIEVETTDVMPALSYGAIVTNYTTPSGDPNVEWRIFYADESNIYLIASDYIHYDYAPTSENYTLYKNSGSNYKLSFNNVYKDYTGSENITDTRITKWLSYVSASAYPSAENTNIRAVAFMLDIERWSAKYANTTYAEYAIGGPTIELWCESYKKTHIDKYVEWEVYNSYGYYVKWNTDTSYDYYIEGADDYDNLYYRTDDTKCTWMWLASPSAFGYNYIGSYLMPVNYYGNVEDCYFDSSNTGLCPLVCLNSNVQLEKQSDGTYLIK